MDIAQHSKKSIWTNSNMEMTSFIPEEFIGGGQIGVHRKIHTQKNRILPHYPIRTVLSNAGRDHLRNKVRI